MRRRSRLAVAWKRARGLHVCGGALLAGLFSACGGDAAKPVDSFDSNGVPLAVGEFARNPSGDLFLVDPSAGGKASAIYLRSVVHGRLVDVYDTASDGRERLWFREFLIGENVVSDGISQRVETDPLTERTRLVLLRENDPERSDDEFDALLREAAAGARPVFARAPTALPPFPLVPRNGALMLTFSDALDPTSIQPSTVRLAVGSPPVEPFEARIFADPNHGVLVSTSGDGVAFRPTRVLIDLAVSQDEAARSDPPVPANPLGLPPSLNQIDTNAVLRLPTALDFTAGQFRLLTNVSGHGVAATLEDTIDTQVGSRDLVRAMRGGGAKDLNRGYLVDLAPPVIVGEQAVRVTQVVDVSGAGLEFVVDLEFDAGACALRPDLGQLLSLAIGRYRVVEEGVEPLGGKVAGVRVESLDGEPVDAGSLLGLGALLVPFDPSAGHRPECFIQFFPPAKQPPTVGVQTDVALRVRFSEAMDPETVAALGSWMVARADSDPDPDEIIVGRITPSTDLRSFLWAPSVPFPHEFGISERYQLWVDEDVVPITDLAGNVLGGDLGRVEFRIEAGAEPQLSGNYALRFLSRDEDRNGEYDADGLPLIVRPEVRGQFLYALGEGVIRPRPVSRFTGLVDGSQPIVARMGVFNTGLQTPLSPVGSRLMHVWRYIDFGFDLFDESLLNLDVEGLHWAPAGGQVAADSFERFRIRVGHSHRFPDEYVDGQQGVKYWQSGFKGGAWDNPGVNTMSDPAGAMVVVHPKERGYEIDTADLWIADSGTRFVPFPLNRDANPQDDLLFTWRDTSILGRGGPDGGGVQPGALVNVGQLSSAGIGQPYGQNEVPTIGLPLLLEYSCYPSSTAGGLNSLQVSIATNLLQKPFFRLFSTGGVDASGTLVVKDPDEQFKPTGGYNPSAGNIKTPFGDPVFYWGATDFLTRVSRVHTIWVDASNPATWRDIVVEPSASVQPTGTSIHFDYRAALDLHEQSEGASLDATTYDPYGNPAVLAGWGSPQTPVEYLVDESAWTDSIEELEGARYVQVRATFIANRLSGLVPELSGLGFAYTLDD